MTTVLNRHAATATDENVVIFARLLGMEDTFAAVRFIFKDDPLDDEFFRFTSLYLGDTGLSTLVLPALTQDRAREVAEQACYSGAPLLVTAQVCAQRGLDAMYDYCETQNMYSMPGSPCDGDVPALFGSGL